MGLHRRQRYSLNRHDDNDAPTHAHLSQIAAPPHHEVCRLAVHCASCYTRKWQNPTAWGTSGQISRAVRL